MKIQAEESDKKNLKQMALIFSSGLFIGLIIPIAAIILLFTVIAIFLFIYRKDIKRVNDKLNKKAEKLNK